MRLYFDDFKHFEGRIYTVNHQGSKFYIEYWFKIREGGH